MDRKTKKSGKTLTQDRRDFLKTSGKVGATGAAVTLLVSARSLPASADPGYNNKVPKPKSKPKGSPGG